MKNLVIFFQQSTEEFHRKWEFEHEIQNLSKHIVKTKSSGKSEIDHEIAKYFYAANSSFCSVENPHFKKLVEILRLGCKSPSTTDLSDLLFNGI